MFRARCDTLALNEMVLHETFYLAMFKLFGNDGILKSLGRLVHQVLESFTKVLVTIFDLVTFTRLRFVEEIHQKIWLPLSFSWRQSFVGEAPKIAKLVLVSFPFQ